MMSWCQLGSVFQIDGKMIAMPVPRRIEGYAIVSEDGMLANAAGVMPDSLKFEADRRLFERGLDGVDVVVHGRHSHERQPRSYLRHGLDRGQRQCLIRQKTSRSLARNVRQARLIRLPASE